MNVFIKLVCIRKTKIHLWSYTQNTPQTSENIKKRTLVMWRRYEVLFVKTIALEKFVKPEELVAVEVRLAREHPRGIAVTLAILSRGISGASHDEGVARVVGLDYPEVVSCGTDSWHIHREILTLYLSRIWFKNSWLVGWSVDSLIGW